MPVPDLLRELLLAVGPSGHEEPAAAVWREAASAFAEVHGDTLGSSYARVHAAEGAPTLAIVGHIDEIGVAITTIDDNGLLAYTMLGGIGPETLLGQRIRFAGRNGFVHGVVARKRLSPDQLRGARRAGRRRRRRGRPGGGRPLRRAHRRLRPRPAGRDRDRRHTGDRRPRR